MAIGLFGRLLSYPVQDDENIHIATALLLSDHHIYRDLGFVHLPNLPLMLNAVFSLSGTDHYVLAGRLLVCLAWVGAAAALGLIARSEEHTSELQSLMRTSYAVFCLKKKRSKHYSRTQ